jgi:drug/metabolite transporter (DMT)-like permease
MALVLALGAALAYGAADFVGGNVSKIAGAVRVVFLSQLVGTGLTILFVPFLSAWPPESGALSWGAAAGVAGASGVLLLYRGLAIGRMSVVAPITGVEAAGIPVIFALAIGERPSSIALAGVVLGLIAVALVSTTADASDDASSRRAGVVEALGGGLAFGIFFICLDRAPDGAGMWPLLGARASSLVLISLVVLVARVKPVAPEGTFRKIALAGLLDVVANVLYLLATQQGLLSLTAVITSMYPGGTVLLARFVLKERLVRLQLVGLGIAAAAVILIGLG